MLSPTSSLRTVSRYSRRARGFVQTSRVHNDVTGDMPTQVLTAISDGVRNRYGEDEQAWIDRIEAFRRFLELSDQSFEMVDYGAGTRSRPTSGVVSSTSRTIGHMTRSSKPPMWAKLLFRLVRETRPTTLLELGSCVGISAAYLAAAVELNGGTGRLISLEGVPALAARSSRTLEELGLGRLGEVRLGEFSSSLPAALSDLAPLGFAFIDGNHQRDATLQYADAIQTHCASEALLVFDDINYDDGMRSAWRQIASDPRFALTVDLRSVGLAVVSATATSRHELELGYF